MKKLNKLFAILVAMAMMAMLSVTAFAANPATSNVAGTSVSTPVTKAIDKSGSESNPRDTYTLIVAKHTVPEESTVDTFTKTITADQTLEDLFANISFDKTGKYVFDVTEKAPVSDVEAGVYATGRVETKEYDIDDGKYTVTETTTYSQEAYRVSIIVASNTEIDENTGNTVKTNYIKQVAVQKTANFDGSEVENQNKPDLSNDTDGNGFKFTNKFNKKIHNNDQGNTDETKDATTARLSKEVALADGVEIGTNIPGQEFNFLVTVVFPANSIEPAYTATVKGTGASGIVTFTKGDNNTATATVTLKAGQWLSFDTIETGATVTAVEDTYPGFEVSNDSVLTGTANDDDGVALDVTNEWDPSQGSVTGILMSNIPYIVLALVAIGGLCAYVVVRRRQSDEA